MTTPPLKAALIPVTPLQQNCTLFWCTATNRGAFADPGGDLPRLKAAAAQHGVTIEKILVTHGHIDHCGEAGVLAKELGVPIEGPHEADRFWISRLEEDGRPTAG
jgi:glyoxylase-like metal-dependent hydrolase (beta-lactamase superfamily II)